MDELVLYTNPMSRGRIARWMLEETGADYRAEILDYGATMKSDAYLRLNPMGKVPALVHGGAVVTEAAAICAYLADAVPEAGLAPPPASRDRGPYYRWLFFGAGPLEAAVTNATLGVEVPGDKAAFVGYASLGAVLDTLEGLVAERDYIAGGRFSAADLYIGAHIAWGLAFGTIAPRPAFTAYAERLAVRPAAIRAAEIDDALRPAEGATD